MTNAPRETRPPPNSRIERRVPGAYFHDAWCIESKATQLSALAHFIAASRHTPKWIDHCMALRNRVVGLVGLKNLGRMSAVPTQKAAADYAAGERVGIFTVVDNDFDEAILGDSDKHLDVLVGIHRSALPSTDAVLVTVTTVVRVHNLLGRVYMLPVRPMHRLITPSVLAAVGRAGTV